MSIVITVTIEIAAHVLLMSIATVDTIIVSVAVVMMFFIVDLLWIRLHSICPEITR